MLTPQFQVVILGCGGGPGSNDLSSYLIAPYGTNDYIALDTGTLLPGITLALQNGFLKENDSSSLIPEIDILQNQIKAYLISHAHLDHLAGMIIDSQADSAKSILGIESTINYIKDHIFNAAIWPNFGNEGKDPINQYTYVRLPLYEKTLIPNSSITVETYPLNHPTGYLSSAFLLESFGYYLAYVGNTSPDALEPKKYLHVLWERLAALIQEDTLRAIFIECSYPDDRPDDKLFGHLKPSYVIQELEKLAQLTNPSHPSLKKVKVFVVHIKNSLKRGISNQKQIENEIKKLNRLNLPFIFPEQAQKLEL